MASCAPEPPAWLLGKEPSWAPDFRRTLARALSVYATVVTYKGDRAQWIQKHEKWIECHEKYISTYPDVTAAQKEELLMYLLHYRSWLSMHGQHTRENVYDVMRSLGEGVICLDFEFVVRGLG